MEIYVVFKVARDRNSDNVLVCTEKAFKDRSAAENYVKGQPMMWDENIQGLNCYCERAFHTIFVE